MRRLAALMCATAGSLLLAVVACAPREQSYRFEDSARAAPKSAGVQSSRDGRVVADPVASGTFYLSSVEGSGDAARLVVRTSDDGGDSFGEPIVVSTSAAPVRSHGENAPRLLHAGRLYAVWDGEAGVQVARSLGWGSTFEPPVRASDAEPGKFAGYGTLVAGTGQDLYVVWLDARDGDEARDTFSLRMARSTDQGASFAPSRRIAAGVCPCCRPNAAIGANGELLVFWRKVFDGSIRDMVVATSRDGGATFTDPVRISNDNWRLEGCPDSGLAVARVGSRIFAAWLTEASLEHRGVWMSWSDDAGAHWAPSVSASQDVLDANYPSLAANELGEVLLVFQGRGPSANAGWSAIAPYLVVIHKDGSLSKPQAIPSGTQSVTRPAVFSASGDRAVVTWTRFESGTSDVFIERGRR